jgi:DNA-binding NarL/FixJ family response regulator
MKESIIRIFIIEDHLDLVVDSLKYMFHSGRDGIKIEGYSKSVEEAVEKADPVKVDLFLLDLYIPGYYPIDNFKNLQRHFPDKPIVIFTSEPSPYWRKQMLDNGAVSYLTKDANREELKLTLKRAAMGKSLVLGESKTNIHIKLSDDASPQMMVLSPLQREIVKYLATGLNHKEIAGKVELSRSRVEQILKELRKSFDVPNNISLVNLLNRSHSI